MPTYQLQIKQVVDYPRCRIYRQFVRFLMEDRSIRVSGGSGLFYFTVLCSYANFRTSYRRIDGISYTVYPGEWVCTLKELSQWFRTRFQCQALAELERVGFEDAAGVPYLAHTVSSVGSFLAKEAGVRPGAALAYLIAPPLEGMYAMDAALKAADVTLCKLYAPPSETNFGGGLLAGTQSACDAACGAFADAVAEIAASPVER